MPAKWQKHFFAVDLLPDKAAVLVQLDFTDAGTMEETLGNAVIESSPFDQNRDNACIIGAKFKIWIAYRNKVKVIFRFLFLRMIRLLSWESSEKDAANPLLGGLHQTNAVSQSWLINYLSFFFSDLRHTLTSEPSRARKAMREPI